MSTDRLTPGNVPRQPKRRIKWRRIFAEILIGIPTSEEHSSSHDPAVENMQTGLTGLLAGLNDLDAQPGKITGVAIYPYWETTTDEWQIYAKLWLGQTE